MEDISTGIYLTSRPLAEERKHCTDSDDCALTRTLLEGFFTSMCTILYFPLFLDYSLENL